MKTLEDLIVECSDLVCRGKPVEAKAAALEIQAQLRDLRGDLEDAKTILENVCPARGVSHQEHGGCRYCGAEGERLYSVPVDPMEHAETCKWRIARQFLGKLRSRFLATGGGVSTTGG